MWEVCVFLFNEQTAAASMVKEPERREKNEEEKKSSAARTHLGLCCVCSGSACEMMMKGG